MALRISHHRSGRVSSRASHPRGFTLIELLVVITIIALLIGLTMPALSGARETARQTLCKNQVTQIHKAMAQYMSSAGTYPSGVPNCTKKENHWITGGTQSGAWCQGPIWSMMIMAEMDDEPNWKRVEACVMKTNDGSNPADDCDHLPANEQVGRITPSYYLCPSAPRMSQEQMLNNWNLETLSKGNYAVNFGSDSYLGSSNTPKKRGAFGINVLRGTERIPTTAGENHPTMYGGWKLHRANGTGDNEFRDGMSTTLLVSEVIGYDSSRDARGAWVSNTPGGAVFMAKYPPNSTQPDVIPMCETNIPAGHPLKCLENRGNGETWASARSAHPGGVVVVMAGGEASFVSDSIEPGIWQAQATIFGGDKAELTQ